MNKFSKFWEELLLTDSTYNEVVFLPLVLHYVCVSVPIIMQSDLNKSTKYCLKILLEKVFIFCVLCFNMQ